MWNTENDILSANQPLQDNFQSRKESAEDFKMGYIRSSPLYTCGNGGYTSQDREKMSDDELLVSVTGGT